MRANSCERDASRDDEADRQRQVGDAGLDRRVAEHGLHVEREEEEHRQEAGDRHQLGRVGGGDSLDLQDRERDERVAHAQLVEHEPGEEHCGAGEPGDRAPCAPADVGCLDQRVDEQQHAAGHEQGTEGIEVREPAGAYALAR